MSDHTLRAVRQRSVAAALAVAALAVVGSVFVTGAGASPTAPAGSATYTDPAGDAQGGPDVTRVAIDGDAGTGSITVTVSAYNVPTVGTAGLEKGVFVWIDTDKNRATGDPIDGTEVTLQTYVDEKGRWWFAGRWNGTDFETLALSPTVGFTRSNDHTFTWTLNVSDLGGATSFRFYALSGIYDVAAKKSVTRDDAPDTGWWDYDINATTQAPPATPPATPPAAPAANKVSLLIESPKATPSVAVSGKPFTVTFLVAFERESQVTSISMETGEASTGWMLTWEPVQNGKMVCDPSVGGKVVKHAESLKNGQARLSFVIPKSAKGKVLKVKVQITATDSKSGKRLTASKVATFRVK